MKLLDLENKNLTSEDLKVNDYLYGCTCNRHVAQSIANIWNGDTVVSNDNVIISQSEDGSVKLVCVINDELEEIYSLV